MSLHLSASDMSDYMGFATAGSSSLHPVMRQQFQQTRQANPSNVQRPINIVPTKQAVEVKQPFVAAHPPVAPGQRTQTRQPPRASLLAARKAAMAKPNVPAPAAVSLTESSLMGPRLDHVEKTLKEVCENITTVDNNQTRVEEVVNTSWLVADVVCDTTEYVTTNDNHEEAVANTPSTAVTSKQRVSVTYPMVESVVDGNEVFLMRRRAVDPETAEVVASWIVVYKPSDTVEAADGDVAYVTNFSFW